MNFLSNFFIPTPFFVWYDVRMTNEQILSLMGQRLVFLLMKFSGEPQELNRTISKAISDYMQPDFSFEKLSAFFDACDAYELQAMCMKQGLGLNDKTDTAMEILSQAKLNLEDVIPQ